MIFLKNVFFLNLHKMIAKFKFNEINKKNN